MINADECRAEVAKALHLLGKRQDVIQDTHGNVSALFENTVYIKPSGIEYDEIKYQDICRVSLDGEQVLYIPEIDVFKNRKPSVDTEHHIEIYKSDKDIKAICHTHSPYATAYAYNHDGLKCYSTEQSDFFGDDVKCLSYRDLTEWGEYAGRFRDRNSKAILLARHGVLTFGKTAEEAVKLAIAVENIARKNFLAESLFHRSSERGLSPMPKVEINKWHVRYNTKYGQ